MPDWILPLIVLLPFAAGLACLVVPRRGPFLELKALGTAVLTLVLAIVAAFSSRQWSVSVGGPDLGRYLNLTLLADNLSAWVMVFAGLYGVVVLLHSWRAMAGHPRRRAFYAYALWTLGATAGALYSDGVIAFLFFWGLLAVLLYLLVGIDGNRAQPAARKTFLIVGGADFVTVLGVSLLIVLTHDTTFSGMAANPLVPTGLAAVALVCVLVGALAKAGCMPFHSWLPAAAESCPSDVMAFLPASLDKLLGVYLLVRLTVFVFTLNYAFGMALMVLGAFTIVAACTMSVLQKDLRTLLAWCAIAQIGYIVLALGTGSAIGLVGALFHMLNHATYKSCLFLCAGNVSHSTHRTALDRLGGLSKVMPATFGAFVVAALAVSGIPPLNGFVSKWMIYQSTIDSATWLPYQEAVRSAADAGAAGIAGVANPMWWIFLVAAMFGSALTLAALMKALYSVFLGDRPADLADAVDVPLTMRVPVVVLAALCFVLGVLAFIPVDWIENAIPGMEGVEWIGWWAPPLATGLLILSLLAGALVYWLGRKQPAEEGDVFTGGEFLEDEDRFAGTQFYGPLRHIAWLRTATGKVEKGWGDLYVLVDRAGTDFVGVFRRLHTGVLTTYLLWVALGLILLLFALIGG